MTVRNQIRLIVYRIHEKGLEILLSKPQSQAFAYALYPAVISREASKHPLWKNRIEFESRGSDGSTIQAIAIEGDWHDLPRIRTLIKHDVEIVKGKLIEWFPELEKGTYVAAKEAFKKLLPHEYAVIKELKDIILDRNVVKNI